jgi:hypothetical protein
VVGYGLLDICDTSMRMERAIRLFIVVLAGFLILDMDSFQMRALSNQGGVSTGG